MPPPSPLLAALGRDPDALAFDVDGRELSWRQLDDASKCVAAGLVRLGVRPGDRVAWFGPASVELLELLVATLRIGAIYVPINSRYQASETAHILADAAPALLVAAAGSVGHATARASVSRAPARAHRADALRRRRPLPSAGHPVADAPCRRRPRPTPWRCWSTPPAPPARARGSRSRTLGWPRTSTPSSGCGRSARRPHGAGAAALSRARPRARRPGRADAGHDDARRQPLRPRLGRRRRPSARRHGVHGRADDVRAPARPPRRIAT
jgi:hypothetical protein